VTDQDQPTPAKKPWYKKWWIWALIALGVLIVAAAITPASQEDDAVSDATTTTTEISASSTTVPDDTTTSSEATSTTTQPTSTTEAPTTTTTLPPIFAEGSGQGDDVVELDIADIPVVIELTHAGNANFAVWSLDAAFENIDLLVNEIGTYDGTRPMQWDQDEVVKGLEISADGDWTYEIRPLLQEPEVSCLVEGSGDSVILLSNFADAGGPADLTHEGDGNFAIWAWGFDGVDLLVNEIGAYQGTVRVSSGLIAWDISANGNWTVDC